jgi:hypothetical protein
VRLLWEQEVVGSNPTTPTNKGLLMSDKKSNKSSTDYAELAGLRIALSNIKVNSRDSLNELSVIEWLNRRIQELVNM